jgi:hypothetical protein
MNTHNSKIIRVPSFAAKRLNSAILTGTLLLGASLSAHAATLSTAPAFGGQTQVTGNAYLYNAGGQAVTVRNVFIQDIQGITTPVSQLCFALGGRVSVFVPPYNLQPGETCTIASRLGITSYTAVAVVDTANAVRFSLEFRNSSNNALLHVDGR